MGNDSYVTHDECEDYRKEYSEKLTNHEIRLVTLETTLEQLVSISKMLLGAVCSGMATIIILLLTRGL